MLHNNGSLFLKPLIVIFSWIIINGAELIILNGQVSVNKVQSFFSCPLSNYIPVVVIGDWQWKNQILNFSLIFRQTQLLVKSSIKIHPYKGSSTRYSPSGQLCGKAMLASIPCALCLISNFVVSKRTRKLPWAFDQFEIAQYSLKDKHRQRQSLPECGRSTS